jgi:hypothetical protein
MTLTHRYNVSEPNQAEVEQSPEEESFAARIHVPGALTSHRERDDDYPTVAKLTLAFGLSTVRTASSGFSSGVMETSGAGSSSAASATC